MADNTTIPLPQTSGDVVATDDIGGVKFQRIKLIHGADGVNAGDVSVVNGLPVSATVSAPVYVKLSDGTNPITTLPVSLAGTVAVTGTFWQTTQPVSVASLPLPSGAATAANQATEITGLAAILSALGGTLIVSAASLPLPSGAATSAKQDTGNTSLSSIDGKTPALGQALAAASVPVVLTAAQLSTLTPLSTIAVTQSGAWNITNISGTISLPTGAATAAKQPALGTAGTASADVITVQGIASMTALKVDGSGVTQPVSGTFWQATQPVSIAASVAVTQSGTWNIGTVTTVTSLSQFAGNAINLGTGNAGTGTLRVVLATDQPQLTNKLLVTPDANSAVNISQMNGIAVSMGNGVSGTGVQRVTLASDSTGVVGLVAGSAIVGKVGIDQTTPGTTNAVSDQPVTSGGLSTYSFLSTGAVQSVNVKASAGQLYSLEFFNTGAAAVYVRIYNKASTASTSDTPVLRFTIPGNAAGAGFVKSWDKGIAFATGISVRVTAAVADNDATALNANEVIGNLEYK